MKIYNVKCFDRIEYETIILSSFRSEKDAYNALGYLETKSELDDLEWENFEVEVSDVYDNYEEFLESEED